MIKRCARLCTHALFNHCHFAAEDQEIYIYGFELLFSTLASFISILCIGLFSHRVIYSVVFLLLYTGRRFFCGGYHATTHKTCFLSTNFTFLAVYCLSECIMVVNFLWVVPILTVLSEIVIFSASPIRNIVHPLSEQAYIRNKKITRFLCICDIFLMVIIYYFDILPRIRIVSAVSLTAVAIMMLIAIIKNKEGEKFEKTLDESSKCY